MPGIKTWSTTADSNLNATTGRNFDENQAPSTINDANRGVLADLRSWYEDVEWRDWGHTVTRTGNTTFTIAADVTSIYVTNRPIRCTDSSTLYGYVSSSSYSAPNTTVTVTLDSGNLSASLSAVALGITPSQKSIPDAAVRFIGNNTLSGDNTFSGDNDFTGVNSGLVIPCQGRLTLTTATPVTTSDVTGATTIYFTPFRGDKLALYDGSSKWKVYSFTELSIAVPSTTAQMYDVFVYDNSGTPTLELTAWTNDTTRATALTTQNGVLVKTGATTRRYVGSFRTGSVSGQTEDSYTKRYVWNYYNRVSRPMRRIETTDNWTYTTAAFRQANNNTANQLDFVIGVSEDLVSAIVLGCARNPTGNVQWALAIGLDSATTPATGCLMAIGESAAANVEFNLQASWRGFPGIGRHDLKWLEYSEATDVTTWLGDGGATYAQAGIHGELLG